MEKIAALFDLFRKGSSVSDPTAWKTHQINITILGAAFMALARVAAAFGYPLPVDQETSDAIAGGIIALANLVLTVTTSEKVGLPPKSSPDSGTGNDGGGDDEPTDEPEAEPEKPKRTREAKRTRSPAKQSEKKDEPINLGPVGSLG